MRFTTFSILGGLLFGAALGFTISIEAQGCGLRYVAAGDAIPAGKEVEEAERYPDQLREKYLKKWGAWCEYDIAKDGTTSATYINGGQLARRLRRKFIRVDPAQLARAGGQRASLEEPRSPQPLVHSHAPL